MTQNRLKNNARLIGLLIGTTLLSNSAAALAQSNTTFTTAKSNTSKSAVAKSKLGSSVTAIKADDTTAPKTDEKPSDKPTDGAPVAPKADDTTAPKTDEKPSDKPTDGAPVAPKADDTTARLRLMKSHQISLLMVLL
jgi:secreted PhoX family phosphatase